MSSNNYNTFPQLRRTMSLPGRTFTQQFAMMGSNRGILDDAESEYGSETEELLDNVWRVSETGMRRTIPRGLRVRTDVDLFQGPLSAPAIFPPGNVQKNGTSFGKTILILCKAFLGTGILVLPKAFSNGGFIASCLGLIFGGILSWHCMVLLVDASHHVTIAPNILPGYGDVGEALFGSWMRNLVLVSVAISQIGFACANLVFVSVNFVDSLDFFSVGQFHPSLSQILIPLLVITIPMVWVRHLKHFALVALMADLFILLGVGYVSIKSIEYISTIGPAWKTPVGFHWSIGPELGTFFGTCIYAFEGIAFTLPVAQAMEKPSDFPLVLLITILIVGILMLMTGSLGYMAFGNAVHTIIFQDMPTKATFARIVQTLYALGIYACLALTLYPAVRILESWIFTIAAGKRNQRVKWMKNLFRTFLVAFIGFLALVGSTNLDKFISLVGSLTCIPLSFVFPALFSLKIQQSQGWQNPIKILKDAFIFSFGLVATILITLQNIIAWQNPSS